MRKTYIRPAFTSLLLTGLLFLLFARCSTSNETSERSLIVASEGDEKHKGVHVNGVRDTNDLHALMGKNIEWVTLIGWGYVNDYDGPEVIHHNKDSVMAARSDSSYVEHIKLLHEAGFKVFLKPHIWLWEGTEGKWRPDIFPTNDANWQTWKATYRDFIFRYARVAEAAGAEMYCIGVELSRLALEKPAFWRELIRDVRSIYSGKITYAANWYEEYEEITFWDALDFVGIQAYFPLAKKDRPNVEEIAQGWQQYFPSLEAISQKFDRRILFTEMGYKSTANSAAKPWEWVENTARQEEACSPETQANCYTAFFDTVWEQDWFAGVHLWVYRTDFEKLRGRFDFDFTPQGKPAEAIIVEGFQ